MKKSLREEQKNPTKTSRREPGENPHLLDPLQFLLQFTHPLGRDPRMRRRVPLVLQFVAPKGLHFMVEFRELLQWDRHQEKRERSLIDSTQHRSTTPYLVMDGRVPRGLLTFPTQTLFGATILLRQFTDLSLRFAESIKVVSLFLNTGRKKQRPCNLLNKWPAICLHRHVCNLSYPDSGTVNHRALCPGSDLQFHHVVKLIYFIEK